MLAVCVLLALSAATFAQTHSVSDYGTIPAGLAPGAPAGSYNMSELEQINFFNASLNITLPLLQVGGRGGAGYTIMVRPKKTTWTVETRLVGYGCGGDEDDNPCQIWEAYARKEWWTPVEPGYDPGVVQGHYVSSEPDFCPGAPNNPYYVRMFTSLTFTSPDGSEHSLYDEKTGGQVIERRTCADVPDSSRGHVFSAKDGSGLTFITDDEVNDDTVPDNYPTQGLFWPAGYLRTADGSVYRFTWGRAEWMRDRNGNLLTFTYGSNPGPTPAHRRVTKITDSLGREVNISYDALDAQNPQYGVHDRIEYTGFGSAPRVVRVTKTLLSNALRPNSGYQRKTIKGLFPELPQSSTENFDPQVVSAVWLPDGNRRYQLFYNPYNEVARLVLPTGGAVDYDYWAGVEDAYASGQFGTPITIYGEPKVAIYRRLKERRQYLSQSDSTAALRTTYSLAAPAGEWKSCVTVDQLDAADGDRLMERKNHYFNGVASQSVIGAVGTVVDGVSDPIDGKEYMTEALPIDGGTTPLMQVETNWEPGNTGGPPDATPWAPYAKDIVTRTFQGSTGSYRVDKVEFSYDRYNNRTDVYEYDYGTNQPGPLLRHTNTKYLKVNNVNGVDYSSPQPNEMSPYLRGLPEQTSVYDGDKERSRTTYEYDNYTPDPDNGNRHATLTAYGDISGLCLKLDANFNCQTASNDSYKTRGNLTGTTNYILDGYGNVTGSVTTNQQYDVAGNVLKSIDARRKPDKSGYETIFNFSDNFGSPDIDARNTTAPAKLAGKLCYAFPTKITNALGQVAHTQYDYYTGHAVNSEDANGTVTAAHYDDDFDRVTQVERAVNINDLHSQTKYNYDDDLRVITTSSDQIGLNDNVLRSESRYDGLGRVTETRQYESGDNYIAKLTQYDALGRTSAASNPYRPTAGESPIWTTTDYDALGRIWKLTTPDAGKVYTFYDADRIMVADQAGKQRISRTNALGKLTHVWEVIGAPPAGTTAESITFPVPSGLGLQPVSKGYLTTYTYDVLGNLRKVEQGGLAGQHRYFAYDSLSRLIRVKSPEQDSRDALALPADAMSPLSDNNNGWSQALEYYEDGSVKKRIDARGVVTDYTYDALGRISKRTYSGETGATTPEVTYTYDDPNVSFSKGRLTAVSSNASTYRYTAYDGLGRVNGSSQETGGVTYSMPEYLYDLSGNMTSEKYPSGRVVKTGYDEAGRVAGVRNGAAGIFYAGGLPTDVDNRIRYAAHGVVDRMKLGNGLWEHAAFNNRLQTERIELGSSPTDSGKMQLVYGYGPANSNNGDLRSQQITAPGVLTPYVQIYEYDDLNRLQSASETNAQNGAAAIWAQVYTYDQFGNRKLTGGTTLPSQLTATNNPDTDPGNNRFISAGYSYDVAGNLLCDPDHPCTQGQTPAIPFYEFDAENKIRQAGGSTAGGGSAYAYDGDGRRVKKTVGTTETVFVYDAAGRLVAEYGNEPQATAGTSYVTQDTLGNTRVVTGSDPNDVRGRYDYMPFGEELYADRSGYGGQNDIKQKFTGKERDETGLDFFNARYFDSARGRFTTTDPTLLSSKTINPQSWNRYAYTLNNPLNCVDANGMWPTWIHDLIIENALPGLDAASRRDIQAGSFDVDTTTFVPSHAPQHAMAMEGQSPGEAGAIMNNFIQKNDANVRWWQGVSGLGLARNETDSLGINRNALLDFGTSQAYCIQYSAGTE